MRSPRYHLTMAEHVAVRDPFLATLEAYAAQVTAGLEPDMAEAIRIALADEAYCWAARVLVGRGVYPSRDSPAPVPAEKTSNGANGSGVVGALLSVPGTDRRCAGCGSELPVTSSHYSDVPGKGHLCLTCWADTVNKALR